MCNSLRNLQQEIGGIQRGRYYLIGSSTGVGKTTFVNSVFVFDLFLEYIVKKKQNNIKWIYFCFEMQKESIKMFFISYLLKKIYNVKSNKLKEKTLYKGNYINEIQITENLMRGYLQDDNGKKIRLSEEVMEKIKEIDEKYISIFFNSKKRKNNPFYIITERQTPEEIEEIIIEKRRNFNKNDYVFVIVDHVRKVKQEIGKGLKHTMDEFSERMNALKNEKKITVVNICHINRSMFEKRATTKGGLYPVEEDFKDSGNLCEDADVVITLFNPCDDKYKSEDHFGIKIRDRNRNLLDPINKKKNIRSIHLIKSRFGIVPLHINIKIDFIHKTFYKYEIENTEKTQNKEYIKIN
jgi:replicative DNA helicase